MLTVREHPGYHGLFTRDEVLGAYRNGSRVTKTHAEPGDAHPNGATATVLGSIAHPDIGVAYFVEWDDKPTFAVLVVARRVTIAT